MTFDLDMVLFSNQL